MLKSVLYYLLLLTTSVRFLDIVYLLSRDATNLPIPVVVVTSAMVLYGIVLGVRKHISNLRLKQLMFFFIVQIAAIVFNIVYVSVATPLRMSVAETFVVGTFLDLVVNAVLVYFCMRQIRNLPFASSTTVADVSGSKRQINV